jgi:hypothetical protein
VLAQAEGALRQQQAAFNQLIAQDQASFRQRYIIGWILIVLFVGICAVCGYVIVNSSEFPATAVTAAASALLVEALGLVGAIIKGIMGVQPKELEPTIAMPALPPD